MTEDQIVEVEVIPPSDKDYCSGLTRLTALAKEVCDTVSRMRRQAREADRITSETVARIREDSRVEIERMREDYRSRRMALDILSEALGQAVENGSIEKTRIALDRIVELALTPSSDIRPVRSHTLEIAGPAGSAAARAMDVEREVPPEGEAD